MTNIQHQEEQDFHHSSDSEWDNAEAAELGQADTTSCWVLTDRDVWHRNPFDTGAAPSRGSPGVGQRRRRLC